MLKKAAAGDGSLKLSFVCVHVDVLMGVHTTSSGNPNGRWVVLDEDFYG